MSIFENFYRRIFRIEDIENDFELETDLLYQTVQNHNKISRNLPHFVAVFGALYSIWVPAWIMIAWVLVSWILLYLSNKQLEKYSNYYENKSLTKEIFYKYRNKNLIIRGLYYFIFTSIASVTFLVEDPIFAILPICMITSSMAMTTAVMSPYPKFMVTNATIISVPMIIIVFLYGGIFFEVFAFGLILYTMMVFKLGYNLYDAYKQMILQRRDLAMAKTQAEEASNAKGRFLATMSHEVRTPLNGILGMANLLSDTRLDGKQSNYLDTIRYSGETLLTMLNDILDFSKMESGKFEIEKIDFDLPKLITSVIMLMQSRAEEKNLKIIEDIHLMVPQRIKTDPTRMRQVLLNLISNAIKFTDHGSITIKVTNLQEEDNFAELKFEVIDTGIGIPKDSQNKLFKEFSQADSSTSRKYGGTGLGLSICQQIISLMNGKIGIESEEGKGSNFWFELPVEVTEIDTFEYHEQQIKKTELPNIEPLKILLVDDNEINLTVAGDTLEKYGHLSTKARNGQQAIDELEKSQNFDIVLMDMQMPIIDGLQATRTIKKMTNGAEKIPVIALTANSMQGDNEVCLIAGMVDHISKPFNTETLLNTLARHLPHKVKTDTTKTAPKQTLENMEQETHVDLSVLENIEETLGHDYMINFLESHIPSVIGYVNDIKTFSQQNKIEEMQHRAHELKSMSAMFGLTDVQGVAQGIETCCQEGRIEDAIALAEKIDERFSNNFAALKKLFPEADISQTA